MVEIVRGVEMKKAVIWDLDGTILDTLKDLTDSVNYVLRVKKLPEQGIEEIKMMLGNGIRVLMEKAVPAGTNNPDFEECFSMFKDYYQKHMDDNTAPYNGVVSVMKSLKLNGYKQAIVSNKIDCAVQKLVEKYYSFVDTAIGENHKMAKKPSSDMVNEVLKRLDVSNDEAVYIGDSEVDLETAQNSGLDCICVTWGFRNKKFLLDKGAKHIIDLPEELIKVLAEM